MNRTAPEKNCLVKNVNSGQVENDTLLRPLGPNLLQVVSRLRKVKSPQGEHISSIPTSDIFKEGNRKRRLSHRVEPAITQNRGQGLQRSESGPNRGLFPTSRTRDTHNICPVECQSQLTNDYLFQFSKRKLFIVVTLALLTTLSKVFEGEGMGVAR